MLHSKHCECHQSERVTESAWDLSHTESLMGGEGPQDLHGAPDGVLTEYRDDMALLRKSSSLF